MINASFDLELIKDGKKEMIKVVLQEISPWIVSDLASECLNSKGTNMLPSEFVKKSIEVGMIVSPKNLVEQIEESDEALSAIMEVFKEVNQFSASPRKYLLIQKESEAKTKNMEHDTGKSNTNRSKKNE